MKNTEYRHFEQWAKEWKASLCTEHQESMTLIDMVTVYASTYPGRVNRLLAEMVETRRFATVEKSRKERCTCDSSMTGGMDPATDPHFCPFHGR